MPTQDQTPSAAPPHVPDRHLDQTVRIIELEKEAEELQRTEAFREHGHSAKTLAKYPSLRLVLIALRQGTSVGEHKAEGRISLQTLSGEVMMVADERNVRLPQGSVVSLDKAVPHDVIALADSTVLLTVCWEGHEE